MADILEDGMTRVCFVPTIASTAAPTVAEIGAGQDLEDYLTPDGLGIEYSTESADVSGLSSTFSSSLPGRQSVSGELTLKDNGRGSVPWSTFSGKPSGYLVVRRYVDVGDVYAISDKVEVYTVQAGQRRPMSPAANEVSKFAVSVFHTAAPVLDAVVA